MENEGKIILLAETFSTNAFEFSKIMLRDKDVVKDAAMRCWDNAEILKQTDPDLCKQQTEKFGSIVVSMGLAHKYHKQTMILLGFLKDPNNVDMGDVIKKVFDA